MGLVEALKKGFHHASPALYERVQEARTSRELKRITQTVIARHGLVVQDGPFAGLEYLPQAAGSSLLPKLLGCYEAELHPTLTEIIGANYDRIIDVGCAEGYYAVGLAQVLDSAHVFAFDIDPRARELCKSLATLNGVSERVHLAGECGVEELEELVQTHTLIVCDCEGCEIHLLDPEKAPKLRYCDVLVELHDLINPQISKTIIPRFQETHDISLIKSTKRDPSLVKSIAGFPLRAQRLAVAEFRDDQMEWAYMKAKQRQETTVANSPLS